MRAFHVRRASWAGGTLAPFSQPAQNSGQLTAPDKVPAGKQLQAWEADQGRTCPRAAEGGGLSLPPLPLSPVPPAAGALSWLRKWEGKGFSAACQSCSLSIDS